ncbi:MAG TPA: phytochelatin synthase family protein [Gammaproteobacteria bacterium]|jgi:hypothetical protein|nr:phytochelatin synthase family protein [Gammaproteobacteria bacterium]
MNRIIFILILAFINTSFAISKLPNNLINLSSQDGTYFFKKSLNENTLKLLSHFVTQKTNTYCGIASAVMILNAAEVSPPLDSNHSPHHYFTQENFFSNSLKKIIFEEEVKTKGISLKKLSDAIQTHGLKTKIYYANVLNENKFRQILKDAILKKQFIIINFLRSKLNQNGGGHHSPIAAYDTESDHFLVLDVSRYKYPTYWVKTENLWKAINTTDNGIYRGFILID